MRYRLACHPALACPVTDRAANLPARARAPRGRLCRQPRSRRKPRSSCIGRGLASSAPHRT
ncbi:protein of unassigned function [Methylobacterium oryzae CBMB20]|uniref:Protein of unassigned function n=1 Tax=Methylobacterium oryzae CBMB20 TaxID=693986 RepID=A0A089Q1P0_9HYPH|nr:protein of unassigned function [Methylobacterium oryzae CBMB20]